MSVDDAVTYALDALGALDAFASDRDGVPP